MSGRGCLSPERLVAANAASRQRTFGRPPPARLASIYTTQHAPPLPPPLPHRPWSCDAGILPPHKPSCRPTAAARGAFPPIALPCMPSLSLSSCLFPASIPPVPPSTSARAPPLRTLGFRANHCSCVHYGAGRVADAVVQPSQVPPPAEWPAVGAWTAGTSPLGDRRAIAWGLPWRPHRRPLRPGEEAALAAAAAVARRAGAHGGGVRCWQAERFGGGARGARAGTGEHARGVQTREGMVEEEREPSSATILVQRPPPQGR